MVYKLYKMTFHNAHFGSGDLAISDITFTADRLFSALVLEAIKQDCLADFMTLAETEDFVLSDAFPYQSVPFLPKPIGYPKEIVHSSDEDVIALRKTIKKAKKLQFLPYTDLDRFVQGKSYSSVSISTHTAITKNQPDLIGGLYQIGVQYYGETEQKDSSLYVIATESDLLTRLMTSLQYSGLGGKKTSGYGQFQLDILSAPQAFSNRLVVTGGKNLLLLTSSFPQNDELASTLASSSYLLCKSSGFVFSEAISAQLRKRDFYKLKSGSTCLDSFKGSIVDVRPKGVSHPVWHFAKPLFYRLEEVEDGL